MNKETIDIIKRLVRDGHISQEAAEKYVPELKESKDEEIRKALISILKSDFEKDTTIYGISVGDIITWLEKSESVNHTLDEKAMIDSTMMLTDEKKHIDRAKQKFKVGDWIINGDCVTRIIAVGSGLYVKGRKDGTEVALSSKYVEKWYRSWTIQDAKDGDVLCVKYGNDEMPFIFTGKQDDIAYCALNSFGEFVLSMAEWLLHASVLPATKEQHDLLFQKMHEAGYEWDSEKKELKKIEQKPVIIDIDKMVNDYANNKEPGNEEFGKPVGCMIRAYRQGLNDAIRKVEQKPTWSEEDEKMLNDILMCGEHHCYLDAGNIDWLKSLKDRVQPQNKWKESLETADLENSLCDIQDAFSDTSRILGEAIEFIRCTESKPQWKPSDEQMQTLYRYAEQNNYDGAVLTSLYNDIRKLKE